MGKKGRTFRKDKAAAITMAHESRKLTGTAGQKLYLECLQLILRRQLVWLSQTHGLPVELEAVVRDLWDVRIRGAPRGNDDAALSDGESEREMSVFSSQSERETSGDDSEFQAEGAQTQKWAWAGTKGWSNPRPLDTLALCHLGGMLLGVPLRVGQLHRWANAGTMPYKQVVRILVREL